MPEEKKVVDAAQPVVSNDSPVPTTVQNEAPSKQLETPTDSKVIVNFINLKQIFILEKLECKIHFCQLVGSRIVRKTRKERKNSRTFSTHYEIVLEMSCPFHKV